MDEYIRIINECLNLLKCNYTIENSSSKLLLMYVCEAYINLSKNYIMNKERYNIVKSYRHKYAHLNKVEDIKSGDSKNEKAYKEVFELMLSGDLDPDKMLDKEKEDIPKRFINNEELLEFINNNKELKELTKSHIIFRLKGSPESAKFLEEKNYIILLGNDYENLDKIQRIIYDEYGTVINVRILDLVMEGYLLNKNIQMDVDQSEKNKIKPNKNGDNSGIDWI